MVIIQSFKCWCSVMLRQDLMVPQCTYALYHLVLFLEFCKMTLTQVDSEKKRRAKKLHEISIPLLELLGVVIRASNFVVE